MVIDQGLEVQVGGGGKGEVGEVVEEHGDDFEEELRDNFGASLFL